jgi:hypothetical protein
MQRTNLTKFIGRTVGQKNKKHSNRKTSIGFHNPYRRQVIFPYDRLWGGTIIWRGKYMVVICKVGR